jgi:hypothetical protein
MVTKSSASKLPLTAAIHIRRRVAIFSTDGLRFRLAADHKYGRRCVLAGHSWARRLEAQTIVGPGHSPRESGPSLRGSLVAPAS